MKKAKKVLDFLGNLIIYTIPIVNVLFIFSFYCEDAIPFSIYLQLNQYLPKILLVGYCLFFPILLLAKRELYFSPVLFFAAVPMALLIFVSAIVSNGYEKVVSTAKYNNSIYHVTTDIYIDTGLKIKLYKCDRFDLNCEKFDIVSHYQSDPINYELIIDDERDEIHVAWEIEGEKQYVYTFGPHIRNIIDGLRYLNQFYYLTKVIEDGSQDFIYLLYECNAKDKGCHKLPFKYIKASNDSPMPKSLIFNKSGEIQILGAHEELIYSYSDAPKCYVEGCSIPQD